MALDAIRRDGGGEGERSESDGEKCFDRDRENGRYGLRDIVAYLHKRNNFLLGVKYLMPRTMPTKSPKPTLRQLQSASYIVPPSPLPSSLSLSLISLSLQIVPQRVTVLIIIFGCRIVSYIRLKKKTKKHTNTHTHTHKGTRHHQTLERHTDVDTFSFIPLAKTCLVCLTFALYVPFVNAQRPPHGPKQHTSRSVVAAIPMVTKATECHPW